MKLGYEKVQWRRMSKVRGEDTELFETIFFWDWWWLHEFGKVQNYSLIRRNWWARVIKGFGHQNWKLMLSESVTPFKSGVIRSHWSSEKAEVEVRVRVWVQQIIWWTLNVLPHLEPLYLVWELGDVSRTGLTLSVELRLEPGETTETSLQRGH